MNERKNYNSIVFLTTLSVYFGLVLVGGTPSILTYAALTRNFDIQNEIEVNDDLDNNPDDCQGLKKKAEEKLQKFNFDSNVLNNYAQVLENLILLSQQLSSEDFTFQARSDFFYDDLNEVYISLDSKPVLFPKDARQNFDKELDVLFSLLPKEHQKGEISFVFDFNQNKSKLETKVKFLQKNDLDAHKISVAYDSNLDFQRCKSKNKPDSVIYENTEILSENNQVFIVTRLPRGSLDALLAKDAQ